MLNEHALYSSDIVCDVEIFPFQTFLLFMKIFTWNCRGAGSPEFLSTIKEYLRIHKPDIAVIIEPRVSGAQVDLVIKKLKCLSHYNAEASGLVGVIWAFIFSKSFQVETITVSDQFLFLKIVGENGVPWFFSPVYASTKSDFRNGLWQDLEDIAASMGDPWLLMGDSNDISAR